MHIACPLNALAPGDAIRLEHSRQRRLGTGQLPSSHRGRWPHVRRKPSRWPTTD